MAGRRDGFNNGETDMTTNEKMMSKSDNQKAAKRQEAQYTPGPWSFAHRRNADGMYSTQVFCEVGETIATLSWYPMPTTPEGVTGTYREGNARLIAAAPSMYDYVKSRAEGGDRDAQKLLEVVHAGR